MEVPAATGFTTATSNELISISDWRSPRLITLKVMVKGTSVARPMTIKADKSNFTQGLQKQRKSAAIVPMARGTGAAAVILIIGTLATPDRFLQLEKNGFGSHLGLLANSGWGGQ